MQSHGHYTHTPAPVMSQQVFIAKHTSTTAKNLINDFFGFFYWLQLSTKHVATVKMEF